MKRLIYLLMLWPVARALAADPNPPLQASALGRSLVRQTTAANMRTVIGAMDSAAGITSATATNISAYQAKIATNGILAGVTNAVQLFDNRFFFSPQDQNLSLPNTAARVHAGKTLRIVNYGDDAFLPQTKTCDILNQFLLYNGTISGSGGWFYADYTSGVTQSDILPHGVPIRIYGLPTGGGMTNRSHPLCDTISFGYYAGAGMGTIIIHTNDGYGGTEGNVKTINADNGGALCLTYTNISMPTNTWRAAITSTGTNAVIFCGQWLDNVATNYLWDIFSGDNGGVIQAITNSFYSNSIVTLLGQYDLAIITDSAQSNQSYIGFTMLNQAVKTRFPATDLLFMQPPPELSQGNSHATRRGVAAGAYDSGYAVIDLGGMFLPFNTNLLVTYYNTNDWVHLTDFGNSLLATRLAEVISNPYFRNVEPRVFYLSGYDLSVAGTLFVKNTPMSPGGAPWNDPFMVTQAAANAAGFMSAFVPEWAISATIEFNWVTAYTGTTQVFWQDTISPYYSFSSGRALSPMGSLTISVLTSNSVLTAMSQTLTWPVTNCPKYFSWNANASTNASARGIVGPIKITVR